MFGHETRITELCPEILLSDESGESCLVVIYGPNLGRRIPLQEPVIRIGRDPSNHVVVELDNVSRRHCVIHLGEGGVRIADLHSTNGTYLNDREVRPPDDHPLRSGDLIKVGGTIFKFLQAGNVEALYHEEIYRTIILDGLTGVHTKRYFLEFLDREMARCTRYGRPLSLLMFDVDHFKKVNDECGHLAGDSVLRELAGLVKGRMIRKEELVARWGGEEFVVVLPESARAKALLFAEKMREMIADHPFRFDGRQMAITVSVGVVEMSGEMTEPDQFIQAADTRLYTAKGTGRNRVVG